MFHALQGQTKLRHFRSKPQPTGFRQQTLRYHIWFAKKLNFGASDFEEVYLKNKKNKST